MMGTKIRDFAPLPDLSLKELVAKDNFYRRLEATLDLSFVRELVRDCYACSGRPRSDPPYQEPQHIDADEGNDCCCQYPPRIFQRASPSRSKLRQYTECSLHDSSKRLD